VAAAVRHNGLVTKAGHLRAVDPAATPEETAAIVAALERFRRATAPAPGPDRSAPEGWRRAALLEAVEREAESDVPDPWINT
jgi:hypothetical protein